MTAELRKKGVLTMNPDEFIRARLTDRDLPGPVAATYERLLGLAARVKKDGDTNDALSWITGTAVVKVGEYIFGADPASDAERIHDEMLAALASTWHGHPDYDPAWQ